MTQSDLCSVKTPSLVLQKNIQFTGNFGAKGSNFLDKGLYTTESVNA